MDSSGNMTAITQDLADATNAKNEAEAAKNEADRQLKRAVVAAIKAGMTRQDVFETTGVARTTINRWLAEADKGL
ncbi:helix-turn-helix DNA binding domain protein [Gordonia phage Syleon]|uniref:Helix-turn-helix DNA binding domain protein n=2 Tax=Octobienvirus TaxID=3044779 RepID=A0AAE8Y7D7_9CAUD|nr:helix-turn-helix DNA binding domain protein [Gordonia phage Kudefre]YP_010246786.1 helix-turn-helix DNA binding domain protein [Gordonia phage Syleon]QGH75856.1 helix-turn-helix DNA binding domain protein [Gordonia phage Syleon]UDL15350.1 helix-turn-helix DNA binding domain protein [Gordonia phage Kudefre]